MRRAFALLTLLALLAPVAALPLADWVEVRSGLLEAGQRVQVVAPSRDGWLVTYALAAAPGTSPPAQWVYVFCSYWGSGDCWDVGTFPAAWVGEASPGPVDRRIGLDLVADGTLAYTLHVGAPLPVDTDICPEPTPLTNLCYSDDIGGP